MKTLQYILWYTYLLISISVICCKYGDVSQIWGDNITQCKNNRAEVLLFTFFFFLIYIILFYSIGNSLTVI